MLNLNQINEDLQLVELNPSDLTIKQLAYSTTQLSLICGLSAASLNRDRKTGCLGGIPFKVVGGRVLYPVSEIQEWLIKGLNRGRDKNLTKVPIGSKRGRGRPKGTTKANLARRRLESQGTR